MTLADQAAIAGQDGQVGSSKPKRRTFSAAYKARILAEYDQAGPGERGALLRRRLQNAHTLGIPMLWGRDLGFHDSPPLPAPGHVAATATGAAAAATGGAVLPRRLV